MNKHFSKEDIQVVKKYMEKMLNILITRQMHIEATMKYHLTPLRMAIIKKSKCNMLVRLQRKGNAYALLVGMQISSAPMKSRLETSQRTKNRITVGPRNPITW